MPTTPASEAYEVETMYRQFADQATGILAASRHPGVDLIVLATHGRSGLGRWVFGAIAEEVLAAAPVPVLLVRAWQGAPPDAALGVGAAVLVPLDGSAVAEMALPVAAGLADDLGDGLLLLRVVPRPGLDFGPDALVATVLADELAAAQAAARTYLVGLAGRLSLPGRSVATAVRVGEVAAVIEATGEEHGVGLVVMATHGLTGLWRAILGSGPMPSSGRGACRYCW